MYLCDSHIHTKYSFDGTETLDSMCEAAIAAGLNELVVTDHYDLGYYLYGYSPDFPEEQSYKDFVAAKSKHSSKLTLSYGIELGQALHYINLASPFVKRNAFDFIIGSEHNLKDVPDFYYIKFDDMPQREIENLWERYLEDIKRLIDLDLINTLGHFTYPLRYIVNSGRSIDLEKYKSEIESIFMKMKDSEVSLEVNTSGLRAKIGETLPNAYILNLYRECGCKNITIGSDAHCVEHVGYKIAETQKMLYALGFDEISVYHEGKRIGKKIADMA